MTSLTFAYDECPEGSVCCRDDKLYVTSHECDSVSNHRPLDCLSNTLWRLQKERKSCVSFSFPCHDAIMSHKVILFQAFTALGVEQGVVDSPYFYTKLLFNLNYVLISETFHSRFTPSHTLRSWDMDFVFFPVGFLSHTPSHYWHLLNPILYAYIYRGSCKRDGRFPSQSMSCQGPWG